MFWKFLRNERGEVGEPEVVPPETPPVEPPPEVPPPVSEPEGEPGGDSPEAVFARKQYREAKTARDELAREKEKGIRLEERLRLVEEQKGKPLADKIYTPDEIEAAIAEGKITRADGTAYIARVETRKVLEEEKQRQIQARPLERAQAEIGEYFDYVPDLKDPSSTSYQKAEKEYQRLVDRGLPDNWITKAEAIRSTNGSLDVLRQKRDMASTTRNSTNFHAETGAGGSNHDGANSSDISGAPATMKAYWERAGLTEVQRKKEFAIWKDLKGKKIGLRL